MHISEGILAAPVLVGGAALAAAGVGVGLARMREEDIVKTAVVASALFVASLVRVPVGPASAHLLLNGLAGIMLGWGVFPAYLVAILLQTLLFGVAGLSTLGVNVVVMALPGLAAYVVFHRVPGGTFSVGIRGGLAAGLAVLFSGLLLTAVLFSTGDAFRVIAGTVFAAHIPVMAVEAVVTAAAVKFLVRTRPEVFEPRRASLQTGEST